MYLQQSLYVFLPIVLNRTYEGLKYIYRVKKLLDHSGLKSNL